MPVASLRVAGVRKHGTVDKNVLSSSDRSEIERKIREEVLTGREVVVAASASGIPADGSRTIDAELTVESGRAKTRVSSRVTVSVTAGAIVEYRTQHGPFTDVAQLQEVSGIGPVTFARIAPHVTL